jgi:signal transduction histidine kinase
MPLKNLAEAARSVSEGNLSLRIRETGSRDEVGHLVETFNRMMDRLEKSFSQARQFTVDASHELKTPLTAVRGQLEVALLTARTPEQFRDAIVAAMHDVERLSRISKTLVQLARAESGQITLRRKQEDLAEITEAAVSIFEATAEEKQIRLETSISKPCMTEADRGLVEQLVYQILSNAMQFTPAGGVVKVELKRGGGEAVLSVSDTGPGIGEEHLDKIFQRFYRVRTGDSSQGGAGLGLAWAAWIAAAHGGRIEVRSAEGRGSTFLAHLPEAGSGGVRNERMLQQ